MSTPIGSQCIRSGEAGDAASDDDYVWARPSVASVVAGRAIIG
jgi:hypothetical protein